jgi:integrase
MEISASRENAHFLMIWNFAHKEGHAATPNPCREISGFHEAARGAHVGYTTFKHLLAHTVRPFQFALRLAYLTGLRPADMYRLTRADISRWHFVRLPR